MSSVSSTRSVIGQVASRSRAGARLAPACARCNSTSSKPNPYNPLQSNQPPTSGGAPSEGPTTHFGFKTIPQSLKESLVGNVFTSVSPKYDVMNDSMSLGIHRLWKESFVNAMVPRMSPSVHLNQNGWENWTPTLKCLDVAGGTGDIALKILDKAREKYGNRDVEVEIVDLNEGMLFEGQKRVAKTVYYNSKSWRSSILLRQVRLTPTGLRPAPQISFTHGNAQELPSHIKDNSIDIYTIAFGIRNCTSLEAVLKEAYRVLKPGGRLGVLEFGKVQNPLFKE